MSEAKLKIWTDGACKGNPGPGGWGAYLTYGSHHKKLFGGELDTTNNRMELMAVIEALQALNKPSTIELYVDSQYVKKGLTEWLPNWIKKNWRTSANKPVKNADLWQKLQALSEPHHINWHWVKGHAGNEGNEMADTLANQGVSQVMLQDNPAQTNSSSD
ncbi:ribonuclease HI [Brackiella oedipodis]|uniref:ribonuclease HI n=1 Tax=Brackiella oedipodis TaxID=124225 RepID=UPI000A5389F7|nr:ribonuclease HI [Brackiella oedipodis]